MPAALHSVRLFLLSPRAGKDLGSDKQSRVQVTETFSKAKTEGGCRTMLMLAVVFNGAVNATGFISNQLGILIAGAFKTPIDA